MPGYDVLLWSRDSYDPHNWPDTEVGRKMKRLTKDHSINMQNFDIKIRLIQDEIIGKNAFQDLQNTRNIKSLGSACGTQHTSLWEVKCPKTSKEGVLRVYFSISSKYRDTIVILDGEFKTEKEADYSMACTRLREGPV